MKLVDLKNNTYIDSSKKVSDKDPKFKVADHIRISKYKNTFAKAYTQTGLKKSLWLKKLKKQFHGHMLLTISMVKELLEHLSEKEQEKTNQQEFRTEKVIKKKGDKIYVKWKSYDSSFNSYIDKKDLIK